MKILDQIDQAVCLTLDKRIKELDRIQSEWKQLDVDVNPYIVGDGVRLSSKRYDYYDSNTKPPMLPGSTTYPTWWTEPYNAYNCWQAHKHILQRFLDSNDKHILLLEDDSEMLPDFREILDKCSGFLSTIRWDMLYFGAFHRSGSWSKTQNENILRVHGSGGFHSVIITRPVAERLIELGPLGPMDETTHKYLHGCFNAYSIYPDVVVQKDGHSFIEGVTQKKPDRWVR